ncbi:MAG: putative processing chain (DprA/Smf) [Rickettsiales bacterium]|nr:putative processing chain (DprA/Smf) [Rickettsiales bacterium]
MMQAARPTSRNLSDTERLEWLRLIRSENVGPRTFYSALSLYGTVTRALEMLPSLSRRGGRNSPIVLSSKQDAEREMEACTKAGARLIAACEPEYPALLRTVEDAPPVITVKGNLGFLENRETVAIVGARNASANGCRFAYQIAAELGEKNRVIVSGLAKGIDAAAHKGSLKTGTVAVIAGGIDHIYPKENTELFYQIAENGAIIAEQPIGMVPMGRNFPQRNRIISGMSRGTCVVEAAMGSGSLITARMALEQGRDVFAVPGSPLDARCRGTNNLIKEGAVLVNGVKDILDNWPVPASSNGVLFEKEDNHFTQARKQLPTDNELEHARPTLLQLLSATPVHVDELIAQSSFTPNTVFTVLLELELAGNLDRHPGNKVALAMSNDLLNDSWLSTRKHEA